MEMEDEISSGDEDYENLSEDGDNDEFDEEAEDIDEYENNSDEDIYVDEELVKKRKLEKNKSVTIDPNEKMKGEKDGDKAYTLNVPESEMSKRRKKLKKEAKRSEKKKKNEEEIHEFNQAIEIVPEAKIEDYNIDTLATTLALGKKMLRKRAREEIIDASYSRYNYEDVEDLP